MVFPSIPVYLDPPNWTHQQSNQQHGGGGESIPGQLPPPPPPAGGGGGGGGGTGVSVRPNSMADRARLAKIPQPEAGLKCPRCDSSNTKFCYFNNYSLSQPRHFCKTCRRYWTRGGALRNVPVGGGCRRNKRTKGGRRSRSKSPAMERGAAAAGSSNSIATMAGADILSHLAPQLTQLPFLPPLHNLNDYAPADIGASSLGLEFQVGLGDHQQWRIHQMQQLPSFFTSTLEGQGIGQLLSTKPLYPSPATAADPMTSVKSEGINNNPDLNLSSRNFSAGSEQYSAWPVGNTNWSDLSGFSSTSTSHLL